MKIRPFLSLVASLMVLITVVGARAEAPEHLGAVPVLLGLDSVKKELGLSRSQVARLEKLRSDLKSDVRLLTTRAPATAVEKKATNATVKKLLQTYNAKAVAVLTPSQSARLVQIEHQMLGGLMLFLPSVQKRLALSKSQLSEVESIRRKGELFASRTTEQYEQGEIGFEERLAILRDYRRKQSASLLRVLSRDQRSTLQSLAGPPISRS